MPGPSIRRSRLIQCIHVVFRPLDFENSSRRVAPAVKHWKGNVLAFPRKGAKTRRRLAPCLGIAWHALRFLNRDQAEVRAGPE